MPNRRSAKKSFRASLKKKAHNLSWKAKYKGVAKAIRDGITAKTATADSLKQSLTALQKLCDKAAKEKVIHKNKANRIKSRYAKKITAYLSKTTSETQAPKPTRKPRKSAN